MRDLLKSTGRSIFEDSLQLDATTFWTLNFFAEFVKRMGYNVLNGLLVIIREKEKQPFTFADSDMAKGALELLERAWPAIYQLPYRLNRILGNEFGLGLRVQPSGLSMNAMGATTALTMAEGEALGFKNLSDLRISRIIDLWLVNMVLKTIISNEAAAFTNGAY